MPARACQWQPLPPICPMKHVSSTATLRSARLAASTACDQRLRARSAWMVMRSSTRRACRAPTRAARYARTASIAAQYAVPATGRTQRGGARRAAPSPRTAPPARALPTPRRQSAEAASPDGGWTAAPASASRCGPSCWLAGWLAACLPACCVVTAARLLPSVQPAHRRARAPLPHSAPFQTASTARTSTPMTRPRISTGAATARPATNSTPATARAWHAQQARPLTLALARA